MKPIQFCDIPEPFIHEHVESLNRWLVGDADSLIMGFTTKYGDIELVRQEFAHMILVSAEREADQCILNKFKDS